MPHIDAVAFHMRDRADEAALARLGAAAVLLWDRIEPETQSHLLSLAPLVAGVTNAGDCGAVLAQLIRNAHGATHVVASAPTEASGAAPTLVHLRGSPGESRANPSPNFFVDEAALVLGVRALSSVIVNLTTPNGEAQLRGGPGTSTARRRQIERAQLAPRPGCVSPPGEGDQACPAYPPGPLLAEQLATTGLVQVSLRPRLNGTPARQLASWKSEPPNASTSPLRL
jgi:hypothetical protein